MIIQRRAGMLGYRNPRITRLNVSLANGQHDAIEFALTRLRNSSEEIEANELVEDEILRDELTQASIEDFVSSDLPVEEDVPPSSSLCTPAFPDLHQEQAAIRGLSALGAIRLPLDEVLGLLTSKSSGKPSTSECMPGTAHCIPHNPLQSTMYTLSF